MSPDMVIIDEGLPDMDAGDLATSLGAGVLKPSVPASDAASWEMPSIRQPSPRNTQVR